MIATPNALARKLTYFAALAAPDLAILAEMHGRRRVFVAGRDMVHQGQNNQAAYILTRGWVCSYKLLSGGGKQIVDFQVPGDFLGFRSVLFRTSDHNVEPVTEVEAAEVFMEDLLDA